MNVQLISLTPEAEKQILFCARVSSDQSSEKTGLIKYLIEHKHWSPFEMVHAVFEVNTTRAIAAQIERHRSFSLQELSQRYAQVSGIEIYQARRQGETNRQSSVDDLPQEDKAWFVHAQHQVDDLTSYLYREAIKRNIAKECARILLPMGMKTKLYMSGSLRSWIHYFDVRCDLEHAQKEHYDLACAIRDVLASHLPHISAALGWKE